MQTKLNFITAFILVLASSAFGGSATWNLNPTSNDWNTVDNWMPNTVPNGPSDKATFATSAITGIAIQDPIEVDSIVFEPGASAYTITVGGGSFSISTSLKIIGAGILNNSGVTQNFVNLGEGGYPGAIFFRRAAAAGDGNMFINYPKGDINAGLIKFQDSSTAGTSTFINEGGDFSGQGGGSVAFLDSSSADHATLINRSGTYTGGTIFFSSLATAGNALIVNEMGDASGNSWTQFVTETSAGESTIIVEGGTQLRFFQNSSAGNATLIAKGGVNGGTGGAIYIEEDADGKRARVQLIGNGTLDLSEHHEQGTTIGSLEGKGSVFLGGCPLAIGANNLSTEFGGRIFDIGPITKIGRGSLRFTNANRYAGGTRIKQGTLSVDNTTGSGTGSGPVTVQGGTLRGTGTIAGAVTVGSSAGPGAILTGGEPTIASALLTIQGSLLLNTDATFWTRLNSNTVSTSGVAANGVTIKTAQFSMSDFGNALLPVGTVLTVINNTAGTSIAGTFSNLPDGGFLTVGNNTFQANYEGGDGNDLTLTVIDN